MNRRSFLKLFAAAGPVAAVAPTYFFAPVGGWKSDVIANPYDLVDWPLPSGAGEGKFMSPIAWAVPVGWTELARIHGANGTWIPLPPSGYGEFMYKNLLDGRITSFGEEL